MPIRCWCAPAAAWPARRWRRAPACRPRSRTRRSSRRWTTIASSIASSTRTAPRSRRRSSSRCPPTTACCRSATRGCSALADRCRTAGALLIFDEVISGFRIGKTGMAGLLGIRPDLVTYGKVIGGGFPVGAYAGRKALMDRVAPAGKRLSGRHAERESDRHARRSRVAAKGRGRRTAGRCSTRATRRSAPSSSRGFAALRPPARRGAPGIDLLDHAARRRRRCGVRIGFRRATPNGSRDSSTPPSRAASICRRRPYEVGFVSLAHDDDDAGHRGLGARRRRARGGHGVNAERRSTWQYAAAVAWMVFTVALASWWLIFGLSQARHLGALEGPDARAGQPRHAHARARRRDAGRHAGRRRRRAARRDPPRAAAAPRPARVLHGLHARSQDLADVAAPAGRGACARICRRRPAIRTCSAC